MKFKPSLFEKYGLFILLTIILTIWLGNGFVYFLPKWYIEKNHLAGTLADSYGILNTLFSGLAFAGLVYTIYLQKKELKETREVFIDQTNIFQQQRFDDGFYNLLDLYLSNRNKLLNTSYGNMSTTSYFEFVYHQLSGCDFSKYNSDLIREVVKQFNTISTHGLYTRSYRTLIMIFKQIIIKQKELNFNKESYTIIVFSQMDTFEISLMFTYATSNTEYQKTLIDVGLLTKTNLQDMVNPNFHRLYDIDQIPEI